VTILAVFADILGTAIVSPALSSLCAYAEGDASPYSRIMATPNATDAEKNAMVAELISPYAFKGPKGAWNGSPPVGYSLSMNLIGSFGQIGSAGGTLLLGRLADKIGAKNPIQICLFMGIFGYIMIYAAGMWVGSYYLFAFGMLWNNFFGNTAGVAMVYFGQVFEGAERDLYVGIVIGMAMLGMTIGSFIVMPFVLNPINGANFFQAIWIALGLTVFALVLVTFVLVPPESKVEEKTDEKTPALAKRILVITVIASALDSGGDEGTRMARGTIMSTLYPAWSTTARQNFLLLAMIGVCFITVIVLTGLKKIGLNLGAIATIGVLATLATQVALMVEMNDVPYVIIWHCGKLFGFLSTFCSSFIIQEIAPKNLLGYWNGWNDACTNLATAATPIIFATIYDSIGNPQGVEMLACTAAVSFLSFVAYAPLGAMMPKKLPPPKKMEVQELSVYENMSDAEWSQLPLEIVDKVTMQFIEAGKAPRAVTWGDYQAERPTLSGLQDRSAMDFKYLSTSMMTMLTDRGLMLQEQKNYAKSIEMMPKVDRDKAKTDMGTWIADYFDDAGYINWETQSPIFKAMLMSAFPPIDALDDIKPEYATMPIDQWEEQLTKVLAVMDSHLASEQRRVKPIGGVGQIFTWIKKR